MTLYIGVDFHPYQQTIAWCNTDTGETQTLKLLHELEKVKEFYQALEPGIVAIEASTKAQWFENLLSETNHQLLVENPTLIRKQATSRHKSDRLDAQLILQLLIKDQFPSLWRRTREQNQVLEILKLRDSLVFSQVWIDGSEPSAVADGLRSKIRSLAFNRPLPQAVLTAANPSIES